LTTLCVLDTLPEEYVRRKFARLAHAHFHEGDVAARFGGDEFCVLSSSLTAERVDDALSGLRLAFAESELASRYPQLSWSAGCAMFDPKSDQTLDDLLKLADERMYRAKAESRATTARPRALSSPR
jgi:diguanylate cyclase (GGDEF)-like protein